MRSRCVLYIALLVTTTPTLISCEDNQLPETVTYRGQVAEVLDRYCTRCHYDGGQGSGDFTQYEVAKTFAPIMLKRVNAGHMPPPVSDPDCRDYQDSERLRITEDDKDILQRWLDDGLLEGDPSLPGPQGDQSATSLPEANLSLRFNQRYTPSFSDSANPGNEYRCFVIEHEQPERFFIRAMHPIVDERALVHHIVLFKVSDDDLPEDASNPNGFDCIDMAFFGGAEAVLGLISGQGAGSGMVAGWAPGTQPVRLAEGYGLLVNPDEKFVMQMHYFQSDSEQPLSDLSGFEFEIVSDIENEVIMLPVGPTDFTIPAGSEAHTVDYTVPFSLPVGFKIHGLFPHLHYLGSGYHMRFEHDGNEHCLARASAYDFDNQRLYMFREAVDVPAGAAFKVQCTWNNSDSNPELIHDPPIDVSYGERTDEEMCFGFSLLSLQ